MSVACTVLGTGATSLLGDGLMLLRNGAPTPYSLGQLLNLPPGIALRGSRQGGDVDAVRRGRPLYHTVLLNDSAKAE